MAQARGASLILPPAWLGDAVLSLPAIRALETLGAVSVLAHPRVAPLFELAGGFARVERHAGRATSIAGIAQARALGRGHARVVVFPRSLSSAIRAAATGAGVRVGIEDEGRGVLLTQRVRLAWRARTRHLSEEFAAIAEAAGAAPARGAAPAIALDDASRARARSLLAESGVEPGAPLVAISPGAAFGPAKRWVADRFASVAHRAVDAGCTAILVGSEADAEVTASVARAAAAGRRVVDLAGKTDIPTLAAILGASRVAVVNDSGPMHLAAALGVRVVALFGSTNPHWTAPLGEGHALLRYPVPCSPCYRRACPIGALCFDGISVEAAWREASLRIA